MLAVTSTDQQSEQLLCLDEVRIDPSWALRIPLEFAYRRSILPLSKVEGQVIVACGKLPDAATHRALAKYLDHPYQLQPVDVDSLRRVLERISQPATFHSDAFDNAPAKRSFNAQSLPDDTVQVCDEILQAAVLRGASDIHLVPAADHLAIQLRVDGQLENYRKLTASLQAGVLSRLKVLSGMDIAEKRAPQDGRIRWCTPAGQSCEMRVATLPTRYGERMTMRVLGGQAGQLSLRGLGMNQWVMDEFTRATERPHGLILLTGPTGCGKSTTLYVAIEQLLRKTSGNVITIEDPIEYEIAGASQVEIDSADKVNFSKALRSLLRHDPDVVMIGEIRDAETASIAVKASLTGHLVFSTLHTNTAVGVVTRLMDLGVEPFLVAATLRLAVAQRLVRKLCHHCRQPRTLTLSEAQVLQRADLAGETVFEPGGCLMCAGRGYRGRTGLFELLPSNEQLADLISGGAGEEQLIAFGRQCKWPNLLGDATERLLDGTTSLTEIMQAVSAW